MKYFDKNGKEIKTGMFIKHIDGDIEEVHENWDGDDLGINASNPNYKGNEMRQIYLLHQFNLNEWEIIKIS